MIFRKTFLLLIVLAFAGVAVAQDEPSINGTKQADVIFQNNGIAIHGYDPVAYFTKGQPVKGSKDFEYSYMGAIWRFASAENKDAFIKEPGKYIPEFGGYCAFGMSRGYAAPTEADAWSIVDGRLYLNFNRDVQREWKKDVPGHIEKANANWPKIPKKPLNP
jgi:YHS domain-containing protein